MLETFFDFCSGIGAGRLGLENCGLVCVGHSDTSRLADTTYRLLHNASTDKNYGNLKKLGKENLPDFDLLIAGFPCQTFSVIDKQAGFSYDRGQIIFHLSRILIEKQPKCFILVEHGIVSVAIRETLYKLENDRADIALKIAEEKTKFDRPLNFEDVKNFISLFASKDYDDVFERNGFFSRFIKKVILFNDKVIVIMCGNKNSDTELAINNDELYAQRILEKLEKNEPSKNDNKNNENKNGRADNTTSHFHEKSEIFKEKEAETDNFVHQPQRGGKFDIQS